MAFTLSEQTKIEAQIGFTSGILIGALAAGVLTIFFTTWEWYFKLASAVGSIGIVGSLILSLNELIKARRNYLDTVAEMKKVSESSAKVIEEAQNGLQ